MSGRLVRDDRIGWKGSGLGKVWYDPTTYIRSLLGQMRDPLYNNAFYISLASLVASGLGLVFWMIAARFYSPDDVGVATALFSIGSLVVTISRMGLETTLTRYFPQGDKSKIFCSIVIVTTATTIIVGLVVGSGILSFLPDFQYIGQYLFIFIILIIFLSYSVIVGNTFYAFRKAKLNLFLNAIMGSRLVFLFPLVALGSFGILGALTGAYILSMVVSIPLLYGLGIRLRKVDWGFIKGSFMFSMSNYASEVFASTPVLIMPSIVLNFLGATNAAFYYIAYSFASILFILPASTSMSLFVEGSHGENLLGITKKTLKTTILLLIPLIIAVFIFGEFALTLVGKGYALEGYWLLVLLALSALPLTITQTSYMVCRVRTDIKALVALSCLTCVLLITLSFFFSIYYGLIGIGIGWLAGYSISAGTAFALLKARNMLS